MDQSSQPKVIYEDKALMTRIFQRRWFTFIIILAVVVGIIGAVGYTQKHRLQTLLQQQSSGRVIAKVGEELIYQKDFDYEFAAYPIHDQTTKELLMKKLATDSAIIQAAKAANLAPVDDTVYNSVSKDYEKRLALLNQIEQLLKQKNTSMKGGLVTIFFINNLDFKPGPLGYERSKELAFTKISNLQKQVKDGKMTIKQAGEAVAADTSLAQLDYSYKTNAYSTFSTDNTAKITVIPALDAALRKLAAGQVSDVFVGTTRDNTGKLVEGLYMFGQVTEKSSEASSMSYDEWVKQNVPKYEVQYY